MFQSNAPIKGLSRDWEVGGQLMGVRLSEVQVGREFDILNVPSVGNLTQLLPSCKLEDLGMSDERSANSRNIFSSHLDEFPPF